MLKSLVLTGNRRFAGLLIKLSICFIFILAVAGSQAQSLSIVSYDSLVVGDANESLAIFAHAAIINNATYPIDVMVKRIDGNYIALTDSNAICWGICYLPDVSVSTMPITIGAGEIDSLNFTGHVFPDRDGIPASGEITYVFFDENNPSDSLAMTVEYQVVIITSVDEDPDASAILLYPNPAVDFINIEFVSQPGERAQFRLYNISGKLMHSEGISGSAKAYRIDLRKLPGGQYFYTVVMNSGVKQSGKIILK